MKTLFLFTFLLITNALVFGQSHQSGTFSMQLDYSLGAHLSVYESKYNGNTMDIDSSGVATSMVFLNGQFSVLDFLSVGAYFGLGSYIEDPENDAARGNKIRSFGVDFRAYAVNNDQFNWYFGTKLGYSALEINRSAFNGFLKTQANFGSVQFAGFTGFNYYFGDFLGFNFELAYMKHNFLMNEYSVNGTSQNLSNFENRLDVKGIVFNLGLSFKVN